MEKAGDIASMFDYQPGDLDEKARIEKQVKSLNATPGDLDAADGYDCPKCNNRGMIYSVGPCGNGWNVDAVRCDCWKVRGAIRRLKKSGLERSLHRLSEFVANEPWQKQMLDAAVCYVGADKSHGESFFVGGAVGSGKTFVCSAICRELLHRGQQVIYMPWVSEAARIKAAINEDEGAEAIALYKSCEVLYIDDFFKPTGRNAEPTSADIRLAYDIINSRYINALPTIVSSEKYMGELMQVDEATVSRLYERAKGFAVNVQRADGRNYRLRDMGVMI